MKKIVLLLLTLSLLLAACGGTDTPETTTGGSAPEVNVSVETTQPATEPPVFEEIVVADNDTCSIRITGLDPDNMWGYTLEAELENKTADTTLMFSVDTAAVNGVQTEPMFAEEVAAGKKSKVSIVMLSDELEANGVGDFTDIALSFRVYDSNDWSAEAVAVESVHVYPFGQENAVQFARAAQETDRILVDNEFATVVLTGCGPDDFWGYQAKLYIVNKTDTTIMVSVDEASVNGYMADPFFADSVGAGYCAFSAITWLDSTLEENGITEVENIEFVLRVYDEEDWSADDFFNETITIEP